MVKYWTRERHRYIVILIPFPALRTKETNARSGEHPESTPGKQFQAAAGSSLQDYTDKHRFSQGELLSSVFHPPHRLLLPIFHRLDAISRRESLVGSARDEFDRVVADDCQGFEGRVNRYGYGVAVLIAIEFPSDKFKNIYDLFVEILPLDERF